MSMDSLTHALIEAAESADKTNSPTLMPIRAENYVFCKSLGLSDNEIQRTMNLTSDQLRRIKNQT